MSRNHGDDDVSFHIKAKTKKPVPQQVIQSDPQEDLRTLSLLYSNINPLSASEQWLTSIPSFISQTPEPPVLQKLQKYSEITLKRLYNKSSAFEETMKRSYCLAVLAGHLQVCRLLQRAGVKPRDAILPLSPFRDTIGVLVGPLAVMSGKLAVIDYVCSLNIPIASPDHWYGLTAAHVAAVTGNTEMVQALRARGVSMSAAHGTQQLLSCLRHLMPNERASSVSSVVYGGRVGLSPLMVTVFTRNITMFSYLLDTVQVDASVAEKQSLLTVAHLCALSSELWPEAVSFLLRRLIVDFAVNMDCEDNDKHTVWHYVPISLRDEVCQYFTQHMQQGTKAVLDALGPTTIYVEALMKLVLQYLHFDSLSVDWGRYR